MATDNFILDINVSSGGVETYTIKTYKEYIEIGSNESYQKVIMNNVQMSELEKINMTLISFDSFQTSKVIKGGVWKFSLQSREKKFVFYENLEDETLEIKLKEAFQNLMIFLQPYLLNKRITY